MKELKKGDKVVIRPNQFHEDHVKEHYRKILEVESIIEADVTLYKIKGVKNQAVARDIHLVQSYFTEKFYQNPILTLDILNQLKSSKFVKELDMYSSGEFLIFEVIHNTETEKIVSMIISDLSAYSVQNQKDYTYKGPNIDFSLLVEEYKYVFDSEYEIMWDAENNTFCFANSLWEEEE